MLYTKGLIDDGTGWILNLSGILILSPVAWFVIAQAVKRCHDLNKDGYSLFNPFLWYWIFFAAGKRGDNKYGPDPKGLNFKVDSNANIPQPIDDVDEDGIIKE